MGDTTSNNHYPHAIGHLSRQMQRPGLQRNVFSLAQTSPRDLVRSKLSTSEISHRAVTHLSNDILGHIPENASPYSLFQGFQATLPEGESDHRKSHRRRSARIQKLLADTSSDTADPPSLDALRKERNLQDRRLEMMAVRKNLCSTEIHGIDAKIANLSNMRKIVLDRLADLENDEAQAEHERKWLAFRSVNRTWAHIIELVSELDSRIESIQEEMDEAQSLHQSTSTVSPGRHTPPEHHSQSSMDASFMSESIYEKLPPVPPKKSRRPRPGKRKSMPVLHEHLQPGSNLKNLPAHNDAVTALDFDMPFGTMVTAALDDTLRVWDLNLSRCIGFLEGHTASVRCLQVEDDMVASGGMDASIRLWNLSRARYEPYESDREGVRRQNLVGDNDDDALGYNNPDADEPPPPPANSLEECPLFVLEAHVDAVTALHMRGDTLVSGSADKTLRQWDLVKGRCVQTLDVLWAAAQASATLNPVPNAPWKPTMTAAITSMPSAAAASSRVHNANADFVGALQCFDAALACGTADGMVRLWDLRSGQVHRSLVGHTGPVTCLQFDDTHLVTGSADRSIRVSHLLS